MIVMEIAVIVMEIAVIVMEIAVVVMEIAVVVMEIAVIVMEIAVIVMEIAVVSVVKIVAVTTVARDIEMVTAQRGKRGSPANAMSIFIWVQIQSTNNINKLRRYLFTFFEGIQKVHNIIKIFM